MGPPAILIRPRKASCMNSCSVPISTVFGYTARRTAPAGRYANTYRQPGCSAFFRPMLHALTWSLSIRPPTAEPPDRRSTTAPRATPSCWRHLSPTDAGSDGWAGPGSFERATETRGPLALRAAAAGGAIRHAPRSIGDDTRETHDIARNLQSMVQAHGGSETTDPAPPSPGTSTALFGPQTPRCRRPIPEVHRTAAPRSGRLGSPQRPEGSGAPCAALEVARAFE
jgi:hypothetical protein